MPLIMSGFKDIIKFLADVMEAYTVALFSYRPKEGSIYCIEHHSLSKHFRHDLSIPIERSGLLSQVINFNQPVCEEMLKERPAHSMIPFYSSKEKLIKALCVSPVDGFNMLLYVDTKHKWSFSRKETLWIKRAADLVADVARKNQASLERDEYAEVLRLFYEAESLIEQGEEVQRIPADKILKVLADFLGTSFGFIVSREKGDSEFCLFAVTPNIAFLKKRETIQTNGGFIRYLFERKDFTFIPRISGYQDSQYVLFPTEPLPKKGSFVGFFESTPDRDWGLGFLGEEELCLSPDAVYGIKRIFRHLVGAVERIRLRRECDQRAYFDYATGFLNSRAFQLILQKRFHHAAEQNESLGLILLQWEPYLKLCTLTTPELLCRWTQEIARVLKTEILPDNATAGIIGENRVGILLPRCTQSLIESVANQSEHFLTSLEFGKRLTYPLRFYAGFSIYPHNVEHVPELWNKAYSALIRRISERNGNHEENVSVELALELVTKRPRTLRA